MDDIKKSFMDIHEYELSFDDPQSFNQKLWYRKFKQRNPLFVTLTDKHLCREYLKTKLSEREYTHYLTELIQVANQFDDLEFEKFDDVIIKPNHGSGWYCFYPSTTINNIKEKASLWLADKYCSDPNESSFQWAYSKIEKRCLLVEKSFRKADGEIADDIKFHIFNNEIQLIKVDSNRFLNWERMYFDKNWDLVTDFTWGGSMQKEYDLPHNFERIKKLALYLAQDLDYVRIDFLYNLKDWKINEFTLYHSNGRSKFEPTQYDFILGQKWNLKK